MLVGCRENPWYNHMMPRKNSIAEKSATKRSQSSPKIPMSAIRRFARRVAERFEPEKIILFGSYAYGEPNEDSDVDILVVMPARSQFSQACKIRFEIPAPFPMDLIVRTPKEMNWRLEEGESFLTEVVSKGKLLYEKNNRRVGAESRSRPARREANESQPGPTS